MRFAVAIMSLAGLCAAYAAGLPAGTLKAIYSNDFEKAKEGPLPDDMMVINGNFAVVKEAGNTCLRLAGDPVEECSVLLGHEDPKACAVSARIHGTATGRRMPEFGIGLGGYVVWVMPGTNQMELLHDDDGKAAAACAWSSGSWTQVRLQIRQIDSAKWRIEAKVWPAEKPEPQEWQIAFDSSDKPRATRVSLWGTPYSEAPIDFDDVVVSGRESP